MRNLIACLAAFAALGAVPLSGALASSAPAKRHHHHHHVRHHRHHRAHGCIPQGNGGDHDADNSGGPSDGDGCM